MEGERALSVYGPNLTQLIVNNGIIKNNDLMNICFYLRRPFKLNGDYVVLKYILKLS